MKPNQEIQSMVEIVNQKPRNEMLPLFSALGVKQTLFSNEDNSMYIPVVL